MGTGVRWEEARGIGVEGTVVGRELEWSGGRAGGQIMRLADKSRSAGGTRGGGTCGAAVCCRSADVDAGVAHRHQNSRTIFLSRPSFGGPVAFPSPD
jgi:hypothetical protein